QLRSQTLLSVGPVGTCRASGSIGCALSSVVILTATARLCLDSGGKAPPPSERRSCRLARRPADLPSDVQTIHTAVPRFVWAWSPARHRTVVRPVYHARLAIELSKIRDETGSLSLSGTVCLTV